MEDIFLQGKWILRLTFNPGLALTGFRTTRPRGVKQLTYKSITTNNL